MLTICDASRKLLYHHRLGNGEFYFVDCPALSPHLLILSLSRETELPSALYEVDTGSF